MSNPFIRGRTKFWLLFPSGAVGHWGFNTREAAEKFATGKIEVVKASTRKEARNG